MIKRYSERNVVVKENVKDGNGSIIFNEIASSEELYDKAPLFSVLTYKENCGIGYHAHYGEKEVILVLEGKAHCNDDGVEYEAYVGDVITCEDGHFHSIENKEKEDLKIVALKVKK